VTEQHDRDLALQHIRERGRVLVGDASALRQGLTGDSQVVQAALVEHVPVRVVGQGAGRAGLDAKIGGEQPAVHQRAQRQALGDAKLGVAVRVCRRPDAVAVLPGRRVQRPPVGRRQQRRRQRSRSSRQGPAPTRFRGADLDQHVNPVGNQPAEDGQDRNQEAEPDVAAPDGGQIRQGERSADPEERAGEVAAPRDRKQHQRRERVQRCLGQEQRQVATPLLPPESVHLGGEGIGQPEAVVAAPPQPVRPDDGDEGKGPDDEGPQPAPEARDLAEQAEPGCEREQAALGARERRDAEDERRDPRLPDASLPFPQQAQQAEQDEQRKELRLETAAAPGGEGPAHGERPGRQPD
jgi:hypothetical protein